MSDKLTERNSSIELFRIVATFYVLIIHLNGWMAGGMVDFNDSSIGFDHKICQLLIESLTIVCVNSFLIISGWCGIKLNFSSIWKMWVLLFSIYVPFYLFGIFLGNPFSIKELLNKIIAFSCENYFIQNYLMLMLLSPVFNAFIENNKERMTIYAISLFLIEVVMESVFQNKCLFIAEGYSLFHFVTMYMLARVASLQKNKIISVAKYYWVIGYFICAVIVCLLSFTSYKYTWAYSNPVIVLESFCLFFPFLYKKFVNKYINWIARGTFAVYVIQVTNPIMNALFKLDQYAVATYDYPVYLTLMFGFAIVFFAVCIVYKEIIHRILNPMFDPVKRCIEIKINNIL